MTEKQTLKMIGDMIDRGFNEVCAQHISKVTTRGGFVEDWMTNDCKVTIMVVVTPIVEDRGADGAEDGAD